MRGAGAGPGVCMCVCEGGGSSKTRGGERGDTTCLP